MKRLRRIPGILVAATLIVALSGCIAQMFGTEEVEVVVDQTFSTETLRANPCVGKFLQTLKARPELDVTVYGMMPDRFYPTTVENALNTSFGLDDEGNFTGGDLQRIINSFDGSHASMVIIISDAENNYMNTPNVMPTFSNPDKFVLIGVRSDLWQQYHDAGVEAYTADQIPELTLNLLTTGKLRTGGKSND
jgi:hypothetical protein